MDDAARTKLIQEWMQARDAAKQWAEHERKLRDYVTASLFGYDTVAGNIDGTKHLNLGNGWDLKAVFSKAYSVKDDDQFRLAMVAYRDLPVPPAKPVITFKPTVSVSGWNACSDQVRALLSPVVTMKPSAPQLTVEQKK